MSGHHRYVAPWLRIEGLWAGFPGQVPWLSRDEEEEGKDEAADESRPEDGSAAEDTDESGQGEVQAH